MEKAQITFLLHLRIQFLTQYQDPLHYKDNLVNAAYGQDIAVCVMRITRNTLRVEYVEISDVTPSGKCDKISIWRRVFKIEPAKTSSAQENMPFFCVWRSRPKQAVPPLPPFRFIDKTHTHTHTRLVFVSGRVIRSSQRPLPTQHTTNSRDEHTCFQRDSNLQPK